MTPSSTLDSDVAAILADREHRWDSVDVDGARYEFCARCGRSLADLRDVDPSHSSLYLPCRGFA